MSYLSQNPRIVSTGVSGATQMQVVLPEAASQSYKAGELVYLVSGAVTVCGADPALILGQAAKDATGTTSADAPVNLILPSYLYAIRCWDSAAVALSSSATLGTPYGVVASSNYWYLDLDDTTNDRFVPLIPELDRDGSTYTYWIQGYFISTVCQAVASVA